MKVKELVYLIQLGNNVSSQLEKLQPASGDHAFCTVLGETIEDTLKFVNAALEIINESEVDAS